MIATYNNKVGMMETFSKQQLGYSNSQSYKSYFNTTRVKKINLSRSKVIESVHTAGINSIDIEVDGRYLLSGAADGSLNIHDLQNLNGSPQYTCKCICKVERHTRHSHKYSVECVQWYPFDTGMFLSSGTDRMLKVWDTNSLIPVDSFGFAGRVYQHHISPIATRHSLIATATTASQVLLVDLKSGSQTHELRGHNHTVLSVRWSPAQEFLLASGAMDNKLILWDVRASKSCLYSLDQHSGQKRSEGSAVTAHNGYVNGLCFTSDGNRLFSLGTDNRLRVWDPYMGKLVRVNFGKIPNENKKGVRFDLTRNLAADYVFVPSQGNILVFQAETGEKVATLLGHYNSVTACNYHPFYPELYSAGSDRNILAWEAETPFKDEQIATGSKLFENVSRTVIPRRNVTEDAWSDED